MLTIDPRDSEYPWQSPYACFANSPVWTIDYLGGGKLDNYLIMEDGRIEVEKTMDKSDNFKYKASDGKITDLGTYSKNDKGLIALPSTFNKGGVQFQYVGSKNENYISGVAFAALLGSLKTSGISDLRMGHWSNVDGTSPSPSASHKEGSVGDLRPLRKDMSGDPVLVSQDQFDKERNELLISSLMNFGWTSVLSETYNGYITPGTTNYTGYTDKKGIWHSVRHNNHFHIQKFSPKLKVVNKLSIPLLETKETITVKEVKGRSVDSNTSSNFGIFSDMYNQLIQGVTSYNNWKF